MMITYAGILEYPVFSAPSRLAVGLCSVHTIDAAVDTSLVNEYSSMKLRTNMLTKNYSNNTKYNV